MNQEKLKILISTVYKTVEESTQKDNEQHTPDRWVKLRTAQIEATGRITASLINNSIPKVDLDYLIDDNDDSVIDIIADIADEDGVSLSDVLDDILPDESEDTCGGTGLLDLDLDIDNDKPNFPTGGGLSD
jgi:hypothetical protein